MNFLSIFLVLLLLHHGSSIWLNDVFTGLNEGIEDTFGVDKEKLEKLEGNVGDTLKNIGKVVKHKYNEKIFHLLPLVDKGKKGLKKVKGVVQNIPSNIPSHTKEDIINKWNRLVEKMSNGKMFDIEEMKKKFKKLSHKAKKVLPKEAYEDLKAKSHEVSKIWKKVEKKVNNVAIEATGINKLKEDVKNYKVKKTQKILKKYVKDAVHYVNSRIKKDKTDIPVTNVAKEEDPGEEEEEQNMEKWVKKHFVKPHSESGKSRWEPVLEKYVDDAMNAFKIKQGNKKGGEQKEKKRLKKLIKKAMVLDEQDVSTPKQKKKETILFPSKPIQPTNAPEKDSMSKEEYEEAERKWEEDIIKETKKLLKKLQPADAYVIPNIRKTEGDIENVDLKTTTTSTTTTTEPEEDKKKMLEMIGKMSGNENWDIYKKFLNEKTIQTKDDPFEDYMEPAGEPTHKKGIAGEKGETISAFDNRKRNGKDSEWMKRKIAKNFANDLANEETSWLGMKKDVFDKLKKMEKMFLARQ